MKRFLALVVGAIVALPLVGALAGLPEAPAVARGATFIRGTQQADGGFGGFGDGQTMDAIFAIRSANIDPAGVTKDGKSPVDFLKAKAAGQTKPAAAAKAALAARAAGLNPRSVGGTDLIAAILAGYTASNGQFAADDFSQAITIVGLACTGNGVPNGAVLALRKTQIADGGWGFGGASDADTTAIALQALLAAGAPRNDAAVVKAVAYFVATQAKDGGWGFDPAESNASSTGFALQSLIAAGQDIDGPTFKKAGGTPVSYLLGQQQADGSFKGFDPAFAANQVVPALAGRTFCNAIDTPIRPDAPAPPPAAPAARPVAPQPPNTGSGAEDGSDTFAILLGLLALAAAGSAGFVAYQRRHS